MKRNIEYEANHKDGLPNEVKHTPTPWHLHDMEMATVCGPDNLFIALCEAVSRRHMEGKENAAFIVRAVNAHDDLAAALKETLRALEVADPAGSMGSNSSLSKQVARAALAKAEGR